MADFVFNIALGRVAHWGTLPGASDDLGVALLKSAGIEADATLRDHDNVSVLLAATNDEADFTNYARKAIATVTVTVNDTDNDVDVDFADQTWTSAGGATNNTLGKLLVMYRPTAAAGADTTNLPLTAHDFSATTDGTNLTATLHVDGFYTAA